MELIIGSVFQVCLGATICSPEVQLFKRFQAYCGLIDTAKYEPWIAADNVTDLVKDIRQSTFDYANKHIEQSLSRYDYKEFLELVIVFLGDAPARGVRFRSSGAMHYARWMSKVIYSIKIWRFNAQFKLTSQKSKGYVMCVCSQCACTLKPGSLLLRHQVLLTVTC